ncbi:putative WRKY transcription factor 40 [Sesamum angolense]|uniref:WRKY transcription factor 40 n=1 Tax=Sesamum angolense TaxID=2727404 RepID=A0AAE1VTN6_9LAMI|nr:putative WRKY transcription factor 40 [Sesamum angolense]
MMEELNRMKSENKKLSDILTIVTRNYNDLMQTRKRKAVGPGNCTDNSCHNYYSCCDETSAGSLPKLIKSNVSRVYVRIDPSDTSLVQRSVNDPSLLVATYEGRHHHPPSQANISAVSPPGGATGTSTTVATISGEGSGSTGSLDFLDPLICSKIQKAIAATESSECSSFW